MLDPLYLILDLSTIAKRTDAATPLEVARAALDAGACMIQLRAKHSQTTTLWHTARELAVLCAGYQATVLVNDRADIAHTLGLHGVHCPTQSIPITALRQAYGSTFCVGASTHSQEEAIAADQSGASFVTLSPFWTPTTKPGLTSTLNLDALSTSRAHLTCPIYALGGITPSRVQLCLDAGASGVAIMSGICLADDPFQATIDYLNALGL